MVRKNNPGLTIRQAADALNVSTRTIRRKLAAGELPFTMIPGKFGDEYRITELHLNGKGGKGNLVPIGTKFDAQAFDLIARLEAENRNLAGQLGIYQERVANLESQVKLLTAARVPWWRRLFGSRS